MSARPAIDHVIVVGASAGGLQSLLEMLGGLPPDLPVPVLVVMHLSPHRESLLPQILSRRGALRAIHPEDGDALKPGLILVAPPDHHLLIEDGHVGVKMGPKENRFRPSVDALFRSAAYTFGPGAIAVVLSGELDDGTSGLWTIKRLGGTSIVQQPEDAAFESMPRSALQHVAVDYSVRATDIGPLLSMLVQQPLRGAGALEPGELSRLEAELEIAAGDYAFDRSFQRLGELSSLTCPECHGALARIDEGSQVRFRCHTGHAYSADSLGASLLEGTAETMTQSMRALEENAMLLELVARHLARAGGPESGQALLEKAEASRVQARALHEWVLEQERSSQASDRFKR